MKITFLTSTGPNFIHGKHPIYRDISMAVLSMAVIKLTRVIAT